MSKAHDNMKAKGPLREEALRTLPVNGIVKKEEDYVFVKETEWDFKDGDEYHLASATKEMTTDDGKTLRVVRTYYNSQIDSRGMTAAELLARISLEACGSVGSMSEYREDCYLYDTDGKLINRWWVFV